MGTVTRIMEQPGSGCTPKKILPACSVIQIVPDATLSNLSMTVIDISTPPPKTIVTLGLTPNVSSGNIDYLVSQPWKDPALSNEEVTFYVYLLDEDSAHPGGKTINKQYLVEAYTPDCTERPPAVLASPPEAPRRGPLKVTAKQTDVGQGHEGGR